MKVPASAFLHSAPDTVPPRAGIPRWAECIFALLLLLLLFFPMLLLALVICLDSRGSALFRQLRLGRHGRPFTLWKFRTMVVNAESRGPALTAWGDSRITRLGAWLRNIHCDEWPQLWNILLGEMRFVGPRPELLANLPVISRELLCLTPGLTSPASLAYRHESRLLASLPSAERERFYLEILLPRKQQMDLAYERHRTLRGDLKLLLLTLISPLLPASATLVEQLPV